MNKPFICVIVLVTMSIFTILFENAASAQASNPALSPWLLMNNYNRGNALSNYHTYVRPQQQAIREFQTQERQMQQQQTRQQQLMDEVKNIDNVLNAPQKKKAMGSSTGAGFNQHLQYYPQSYRQGNVPQFHRQSPIYSRQK